MPDSFLHFENLYRVLSTWITAHFLNIVISVVVAALIVAVLLGLKALLLRVVTKLGDRLNWPAVFAAVIHRTRLWFLVIVGARMVQGYANPPQAVAQTIGFVFVIATAFQVAIWVRTFIIGVIEHRTIGVHGSDSDMASALGIVRLLISAAVFAVAAIVVLDNLGVNVTGLIAGLGIGGIAIGLAAQGIFSDLFAALSIIFDKPFRVGDMIVYGGKEGPVTGTVERIGLKSTRIRANTGELRVIGNTQLLGQELTNLAGRSLFRFNLPVGVVYQTDNALLREIPNILTAEVAKTKQKIIRAGFKSFGPSSIDFEFIFDVQVADGAAANEVLQTVALGVLQTFNEKGIKFAYPTQTSFTAAPDGTLVMPYLEEVGEARDAVGMHRK